MICEVPYAEKLPLSLAEIKTALAAYGIKAERKSLYEDISILETYGMDICRVRTNTVRYYVGSREFQIAELKLLVDAIQSSKYITRKKSLELIAKLEHLASENEGKQLHREVYVTHRVKTPNERIYYNVDILHNAISDNRQITFVYYQWAVDFEKSPHICRTARKDGARYRVSPWALCWDDENYYLVAYDEQAQKIKHYRVDKMEQITVEQEERCGGEAFEAFNPALYSQSVFSMFGGAPADVRLLVNNSLVGVIADRFGTDIFISAYDEEHFTVTVRAVLSPQFYAWVFGLGGGAQILFPQEAIDGFSEMLMAFSQRNTDTL